MSTCFLVAHHLYNSICYCTVTCLVFEMEIKYDDVHLQNANAKFHKVGYRHYSGYPYFL